MTVILLTLGLFVAWWGVGLAVLAAVRADTASLRVTLTAPAVGTAVTALPLFVVSAAGASMSRGAPLVVIALVTASATVLALRRPAVPLSALPVLAICIGGLLLAGWPMFGFGFRWIADANGDMANYVLSATYLLHHGVLAPVDLVGLSRNRNYVSVLAPLHREGARPGADITLAALAAVIRRPPVQLFMPVIFALNLSAICGAAALAMQASRRWWAAVVAAALLSIAPPATYGVLVQLMPQVWGLGLGSALFALLMRPELHQAPGARLKDMLPIGVLLAALCVVYIELATTLALAYALYVGVLAIRREINLRAAARIWVPSIAFVVVVLNTYLIRELRFVRSQTSTGIHGLIPGPPNWGYTLTPSGLSGLVGFQSIPVLGTAPRLELSIAAAAVLLACVLVLILLTALRGAGASIVLVSFAATGIYLAARASDFGLFKLTMYAQPFLAAAVGSWVAACSRRTVAVLAIPAVLIAGVQVRTQQDEVRYSKNPLDLRNASSRDLLPVFNRLVNTDRTPIISVTENSVLGRLEAASAGSRPLYFVDQNFFLDNEPEVRKLMGWHRRSFQLMGTRGKRIDPFWENTHTSAVLSSGRCTIVLPTGTQSVLNRRFLSEESGDLSVQSCSDIRPSTLAFTASVLGWGVTSFADRRYVSFYPPESDYFFPGHTMSGFGRYTLFRVLNPSPGMRLEISLSTTLLRAAIPPATVIGNTRVRIALDGFGSARSFSAPLRAQQVNGQSYVLLDLGRDGRLPMGRRDGIEGVYGRSIPLDPRYLTAFVRDASLVSAAQYRHLHRPHALTSFPSALANQNLEYAGIYEDGWVGRKSYAVLAGGGAADLLLRADVPPTSGGQRLRLLINGRNVAARVVTPGHLELRVAVPQSVAPRRVTLLWASARPLPGGDVRPAAALLQFLGVVAPAAPPLALQHFPGDLSAPKANPSGIMLDGWLKQHASVTLRGGPAAAVRLRAEVPPAPNGQRLRLAVNGHLITDQATPAGSLELRLPVPASAGPRTITLDWQTAAKLPAPDGRIVAALIHYLGVVARK